MTSSETARKADGGGRSPVRRLLDAVFGYDFFISYAWSDGGAYAEQLARRLELSGFDVFLDRDDFASGDNWRGVGRWTLRRTGQLILVGSPAALNSEPVWDEIETFAATGRRIIPIDFDGSLDRLEASNRLHAHLPPELLRIRESAAALTSGPTDETLATVRRTFNLVRQDKKRLRVLGVVAAVLAVLAVVAVVFAVRARISEQRAQVRALEAQAGQRYTEAATFFARADAADSAGETEMARQRDLYAQRAELGFDEEFAPGSAEEARYRNLDDEIADTKRSLAQFHAASVRDRRLGRRKLEEGHALWRRVQALGGATGAAPFAPVEPSLFSVEILTASDGQSLILHYGRADAPRFVLVDGGASRTFESFIQPRLRDLKERWSPATPLPLELVAVSNQDDERLKGIMRLFETMLDERERGSDPTVRIDRLWHNSFGPTWHGTGWQKMKARALIERLRLPLNAPFDHLVMRPDRGRLTIELADGLRATILGPDRPAVRKLFELWSETIELTAAALAINSGGSATAPAPLVFPKERFSNLRISPRAGKGRLDKATIAAGGNGDDSPSNRASLIILFEFGRKRFLHTGDANGEQILAGLDAAGLLDRNGRISLDLLLLPHLGSDRNVSTTFFERVRADNYLITGTGRSGNPSVRTLEMLLEATRGSCPKLYLLNREGREEMGARIASYFARLPPERCASRIFRSSSINALTIDLTGRLRY